MYDIPMVMIEVNSQLLMERNHILMQVNELIKLTSKRDDINNRVSG